MPAFTDRGSRIRLARINDLTTAAGLLDERRTAPDPGHGLLPFIFAGKAPEGRSILKERILDRCLLVAEQQGEVVAAAGLDLDQGRLSEVICSRLMRDVALLASLVTETERLAARFGLQELTLVAPPADERMFRSLGFKAPSAKAGRYGTASATSQRQLVRSLRRRQTAFGRQVRALGDQLGIPPDYGRRHRLWLQPEAPRLTVIGADIYGREQRLTPRASAAWRRMQHAAMKHGVQLQPVSAWRSVNYQCEVLRRKLSKGLTIAEILAVSAAPGFSQHHSGRAIDITTPGFAVLEEEFELSPAFHWMRRHASQFGFDLSFPRNNRHRLAYEPWHWCFNGGAGPGGSVNRTRNLNGLA